VARASTSPAVATVRTVSDLAGLLVLLDVQLGHRWIVEVVRRVLVLLSLFKERVPEPVLYYLGLQLGPLRDVGYLLVTGRLVYVEVLPKHLQLILGDSCPTSAAVVQVARVVLALVAVVHAVHVTIVFVWMVNG